MLTRADTPVYTNAMLSEYQGPANSTEILRYLVDEVITAAYQNEEGRIVLVLESGRGIVFGSFGDGGPVFWPIEPEAIRQDVSRRRAEIEQRLAELNMPGIDLPTRPRGPIARAKRRAKKAAAPRPKRTETKRRTALDHLVEDDG